MRIGGIPHNLHCRCSHVGKSESTVGYFTIVIVDNKGYGIERVRGTDGDDAFFVLFKHLVGVAMAGDTAYLRGASVIAMLGLAPTNPGLLYVGAEKRIRRQLPRGFRLKDRTPCETTEYEGCEGIRCQRLVDALKTARDEGAIEADRIADAAEKAREKGLLTDEECAEFTC